MTTCHYAGWGYYNTQCDEQGFVYYGFSDDTCQPPMNIPGFDSNIYRPSVEDQCDD